MGPASLCLVFYVTHFFVVTFSCGLVFMNQNFLCRLGNRLWFRLSYFELGLRLPPLLPLHMASEDYYSHRAGVSDNEGWGSGKDSSPALLDGFGKCEEQKSGLLIVFSYIFTAFPTERERD